MSGDMRPRGTDARTFKLQLLMAYCLTLPVMVGSVSPWLLGFPALIVVLAFCSRISTVRRIQAWERRQIEGPT